MDLLTEAERKLQDLIEDRERLQSALSKAVEDADAETMIRNRRALEDNNVRQYAARARIMRLRKVEDEQQRALAINERDALEAELVRATQAYAKAIEEADRLRIARQEIEVRLFSIDSRAEILRESINETTTELRQYVARWSEIKAAGDDNACSI
jgi:hypothetical protein